MDKWQDAGRGTKREFGGTSERDLITHASAVCPIAEREKGRGRRAALRRAAAHPSQRPLLAKERGRCGSVPRPRSSWKAQGAARDKEDRRRTQDEVLPMSFPRRHSQEWGQDRGQTT